MDQPLRETRPLRLDEPRLSCIRWPRCRLRAVWLIRGTSFCRSHGRREIQSELAQEASE